MRPIHYNFRLLLLFVLLLYDLTVLTSTPGLAQQTPTISPRRAFNTVARVEEIANDLLHCDNLLPSSNLNSCHNPAANNVLFKVAVEEEFNIDVPHSLLNKAGGLTASELANYIQYDTQPANIRYRRCVESFFTLIPHKCDNTSRQGQTFVYQWIVHGAGRWHVTVKNNICSVKEGYDPVADGVAVFEAKDFVDQMILKHDNLQRAYMKGRMAFLRDYHATMRSINIVPDSVPSDSVPRACK